MIKYLLFDFSGVLVQNLTEMLDKQLVEFIQDQQKQGRPTGILSNSGWTLKQKFIASQLDGLFHDTFLAKELGWAKDQTATYQKVAEQLGLAPSEILFTDDNERNVAAAQEAGLTALYFESTESYLRRASQILAY